MRSCGLIDKDHGAVAHDRKIDRFAGGTRGARQNRVQNFGGIDLPRLGKRLNLGAKPIAAGGRRHHHQALVDQRVDDALHGRARQLDPVSDLAKAHSGIFMLERTQHVGGAGNHLNALRTANIWRFCIHGSQVPD